MRIIALMLSLFFSTSVLSREIQVHYGHFHYKLNYSKEMIKFERKNQFFVMRKKDCNKHIINRFHNSLERLIQASPLMKGITRNHVQMIVDGDYYKENSETKRSYSLVNLHKHIKQIEKEEKINCL